MKSNYRRLRVIHVIIAALGTLLLTGFFIVFLITGYTHSMETQQDHLRLLASNAASRTQTILGDIVVTMRLLDIWIADNPDSDPRFSAPFANLIEAYHEHTGGKTDIRAVSDTGGLFYFPSETDVPLTDVSDREYFRAQLETGAGTVYFASPVKSRITNQWGIPISYKLHPNRYGILILFAFVESSVFDEAFAELLDSPDKSVDIIRADRFVLARTPYNETIVGNFLEFNPEEAGFEVLTVESPAFGTGDGRFRAVYSQRLEQLPLLVMVADSYAQMKKHWLGTTFLETLVMVVMIFVFILLNVLLFRYTTKNREFQKQLERAARIDFLTGLKNRQYFFERAEEEIERTKRAGTKLSMLVIDIDDFKYVNDTYGHPAGDTVLRTIASHIAQNVRAIDHAGRIGGEEFAVILPETDMEAGTEIAERIRVAIRYVAHGEWQAGVSVGIAEWAGPEETIDNLFARADKALYEAKAAGKNRVVKAG